MGCKCVAGILIFDFGASVSFHYFSMYSINYSFSSHILLTMRSNIFSNALHAQLTQSPPSTRCICAHNVSREQRQCNGWAHCDDLLAIYLFNLSIAQLISLSFILLHGIYRVYNSVLRWIDEWTFLTKIIVWKTENKQKRNTDTHKKKRVDIIELELTNMLHGIWNETFIERESD